MFSGDIGRYDVPLHKDPETLPDCDALVIESTYGDRLHQKESLEDQILENFLPVIHNNGFILIPSFAVGRAQLITVILRKLMINNRLPNIPIHIDSPMAVDATELYSKYMNDQNLDEGIRKDGRSTLFPHNVYFHRTMDESKRINELRGPRIIISSSGMLTGGRVLHHLSQRVGDPKNLLCMVGYQADGTRGRKLLEGSREIRNSRRKS